MTREKSKHVDSAEAVGRRLRQAREAAGLSQRQLAFPGCTPAYISRLEAGQRIPSLQLARELARRLGVRESWLTTGSDYAADALLEDADIALRLDQVDEAERLFDLAADAAPTAQDRARILEGSGRIAMRRGAPR